MQIPGGPGPACPFTAGGPVREPVEGVQSGCFFVDREQGGPRSRLLVSSHTLPLVRSLFIIRHPSPIMEWVGMSAGYTISTRASGSCSSPCVEPCKSPLTGPYLRTWTPSFMSWPIGTPLLRKGTPCIFSSTLVGPHFLFLFLFLCSLWLSSTPLRR